MDEKFYKNFENEIKKKAKSRDMYKIIFTTEDGKDIEYEIIATFKSRLNKKIYFIMTDNTRSEKDELNVFAFYILYDETENEPSDVNETFYPVVDADELKMVFYVFDKIKRDL